MTKIEVPTSVTLYVQWLLHPFQQPQLAEQKSANSKWALAKTKELLDVNSIDSDEVKIAVQFNGKVLLEIQHPEMKRKDGIDFWEEVLSVLSKSNEIESIFVYVNNDVSDKIASKLADLVNHPWHQGYQGQNKSTLIYHK